MFWELYKIFESKPVLCSFKWCSGQLFVDSSHKRIYQSQRPLKSTMTKHPASLLVSFVLCVHHLFIFEMKNQILCHRIMNDGQWTVNCERFNGDKSASNQIHHNAYECQTDEKKWKNENEMKLNETVTCKWNAFILSKTRKPTLTQMERW